MKSSSLMCQSTSFSIFILWTTLTLQILSHHAPLSKVFSSAPNLEVGVINIKMLLWSMFWRKLKVRSLRGRFIMTLFFSLNLSCCSLPAQVNLLHKTSPSDTPAISGCSRIQSGFVLHPSSDSLRVPCLSVNAERLYFLEDRWSWVVVVLFWLDTVVVSTCSVSFLPTGHGCVAKCDSLSSRTLTVDELLTKLDFSQKPLGLFARSFRWCHFREHFWGVILWVLAGPCKKKSVPIEPALQAVRTLLENDQSVYSWSNGTNLKSEEILHLLEICLRESSFKFRGQFYEMTNGLAMGYPVSPIVANILMSQLEEKAISAMTCHRSLRSGYVLWTTFSPLWNVGHCKSHWKHWTSSTTTSRSRWKWKRTDSHHIWTPESRGKTTSPSSSNSYPAYARNKKTPERTKILTARHNTIRSLCIQQLLSFPFCDRLSSSPVKIHVTPNLVAPAPALTSSVDYKSEQFLVFLALFPAININLRYVW